MRKILFFTILLFFMSCSQNPEIDTVVSNPKIIKEIDRFIADLNNEKKEKFIVVSGIDSPQHAEILFTNNKPTFAEDGSPSRRKEMEEGRYGYFTYKEYEFLVSESMKNNFKLDYEDFEHMKKHFTVIENTPNKPSVNSWKVLHMKIDKQKDSVEFSSISELKLPTQR